MRRASPTLSTALALSSLLWALPARAADPDPWWGRDKALHFGAGAVLGAGGYAAGTLIFDRRLDAALFGGGVALGVGAAKEGADALGLGSPSWKDFAWDAIGAAVGVAIAWGIDLLIAGAKSPEPAR